MLKITYKCYYFFWVHLYTRYYSTYISLKKTNDLEKIYYINGEAICKKKELIIKQGFC